MRHWQRTIEQGNRCFVTGALIDAREHYLQRTYVELLSFIGEHGAYPRTERLLKGPPNAEVRPEFLAPPPSLRYH